MLSDAQFRYSGKQWTPAHEKWIKFDSKYLKAVLDECLIGVNQALEQLNRVEKTPPLLFCYEDRNEK